MWLTLHRVLQNTAALAPKVAVPFQFPPAVMRAPVTP